MKDSCPAEFTRLQKSRKVDLAHAKLIVCWKSLNTSVVVVRRRPLLLDKTFITQVLNQHESLFAYYCVWDKT